MAPGALAVGGRLGVGNDPRYNKSRCFETFPFPDEDTGLTPALRERIAALAEQIDAHRKCVLSLGQPGPVTDFGSFMRAPAPAAPASEHQASTQHALEHQASKQYASEPPAIEGQTREGLAKQRQAKADKGLTLAGLYNVLEALREGGALTTKEKAIHEQGLVAVLKDLHDDLDAAVLDAYGWDDLQGKPDTAVLLECQLALNTRRAAEEKQGRICWLRPAFQNPAVKLSPQDQELAVPISNDLQTNLGLEPTRTSSAADTQTTTWPATLPDQVRAVAQVLAGGRAASAVGALSQADIEARFKGRGPWKKGLPRILETLEALGRARREGDNWRA